MAFEKKRIGLKYWNSNGVATAIVAVVNYLDGELFDWAAYIGGTTKTQHEEDAYEELRSTARSLIGARPGSLSYGKRWTWT